MSQTQYSHETELPQEDQDECPYASDNMSLTNSIEWIDDEEYAMEYDIEEYDSIEYENFKDIENDFEPDPFAQMHDTIETQEVLVGMRRASEPIIPSFIPDTSNNEAYRSMFPLQDNLAVVSMNNDDSLDIREKKRLLNLYLSAVLEFKKEDWEKVERRFQGDFPLRRNRSNIIDMYRIGVNKVLYNYSRNWNFAKNRGNIYIYNGQKWVSIEETLFKEFLREVSKKMRVPELLFLDRKFIKGLYEDLYDSPFFKEMLRQDLSLLNFKNTTLKITSDGIQPVAFDPAHMLRHQHDYDYDPSQTNHVLLSFLDDVLPNKDTQKTLQQALGYLFVQGLKLEVVIFLYGTGSNGKSVIFEVLNGILDSELISNYSIENLVDSKGYHLAKIEDKLVNYCTDISLKKLDHGMFKRIASGEPVDVRPIRNNPYVIKNYAKLCFNINRIDDADIELTIGFLRRLLYIPFMQTIPEERRDKTLHKKILENKAGVLNWILEGAREVIANQRIYISKECFDFMENFRKESNLVIRFIEESGFHTSHTDTISFQDMYTRFIKFAKSNGEKSMTKRHLNNELKKHGLLSSRKNSGFVWHVCVHNEVKFGVEA